MREEIENHIMQCFQAINNHYNFNLVINSLEKKEEVMEAFETINAEVLKTLKEYVMLFDSYCFIKSDKILMFKARDIWKMELNSIGDAMRNAKADLDIKMGEKGM